MNEFLVVFHRIIAKLSSWCEILYPIRFMCYLVPSHLPIFRSFISFCSNLLCVSISLLTFILIVLFVPTLYFPV